MQKGMKARVPASHGWCPTFYRSITAVLSINLTNSYELINELEFCPFGRGPLLQLEKKGPAANSIKKGWLGEEGRGPTN